MSHVPTARSRALRWLKLGFGLVVLGALFMFVNVRAVAQTVLDAAPLWVGLAIAANFAARLLAAERTLVVTRALGMPLGRGRTIIALFISNLWSLLLPGVSAGTVSTVYQYRRHGARTHSSVGALGASRVLELFAFAALAFMGLLLAARDGPNHPERVVLIGIAALMAAALVGMVAIRLLPSPRAHVEPPTFWGRTSRFVLDVAATIRRLRSPDYARGLAIALLQGVSEALIVWCLARSLGLDLNLAGSLWVNGLSYFIILLPVSIAGLGMREVAILTALTPWGVARHVALALAFLMLAATLLNALVGAVIQLSILASPLRRVSVGDTR
ncbi:MAG: lysylphosphatidylglycerol synthase transmembrane domain-containing protein [Steroidobacteraceae bacterium]